jgi:hypothetical protein
VAPQLIDPSVETFLSHLPPLRLLARRFRQLAFELERLGWLPGRAEALENCAHEMLTEASGDFDDLRAREWSAAAQVDRVPLAGVIHDFQNLVASIWAAAQYLLTAPNGIVLEDAQHLAGDLILLAVGSARAIADLKQSSQPGRDAEAAIQELRRRIARGRERFVALRAY